MSIEIRVPDIGNFSDVDVIDILVKVGDTVAIDDALITLESDKASMDIPASRGGVVQEINWRTTKLLTPEENTVYVPNSVIGTSVLTNHSAPKTSHEIKLNITLGFDVEPARAKRILLAAALAAADDNGPVLATPAPKVRITNTQPEGVDYRISFMAARSPGPAARRSRYRCCAGRCRRAGRNGRSGDRRCGGRLAGSLRGA